MFITIDKDILITYTKISFFFSVFDRSSQKHGIFTFAGYARVVLQQDRLMKPNDPAAGRLFLPGVLLF